MGRFVVGILIGLVIGLVIATMGLTGIMLASPHPATPYQATPTFEPAYPRVSAPVPTVSATAFFAVQIDGSTQQFSGACLVSDPNGSSSQQSLSGFTPKSYTYTGAAVSCSFQNLLPKFSDQYGLRLTIQRNGRTVKEVESSVLYGMVSAAVGLQ